MTILGITGPTGSGKTTLLGCIEARGGCVLDLDAVYHELLKTDASLLSTLDQRFPGVVKDGALTPFTLKLGEMTGDERQIILDGCLINFNRVK